MDITWTLLFALCFFGNFVSPRKKHKRSPTHNDGGTKLKRTKQNIYQAMLTRAHKVKRHLPSSPNADQKARHHVRPGSNVDQNAKRQIPSSFNVNQKAKRQVHIGFNADQKAKRQDSPGFSRDQKAKRQVLLLPGSNADHLISHGKPITKTQVSTRKKHKRSISIHEDDVTELRRTKRNLYQALLKRRRLGKRQIPTNFNMDMMGTPRSPMARPMIKGQVQVVNFQIKVVHDWRDEMLNVSSPEYELLVGNIVDAFANELTADYHFHSSAVTKLRKADRNHMILADVATRFYRTEGNPLPHLQGIISKGWVSGQKVDPEYFVLLGIVNGNMKEIGKLKFPQKLKLRLVPPHIETSTPSPPAENETEKVQKTLKFKEIRISIKLKQLYGMFLSDRKSPEFKELGGNLEQAIYKIFSRDSFFVGTKTLGFRESPEGRCIAVIAIDFKTEEKYAIEKMQAMISGGDLAGMPVDDTYLIVNSLSEVHLNGTVNKPANPLVHRPNATTTKDVSTSAPISTNLSYQAKTVAPSIVITTAPPEARSNVTISDASESPAVEAPVASNQTTLSESAPEQLQNTSLPIIEIVGTVTVQSQNVTNAPSSAQAAAVPKPDLTQPQVEEASSNVNNASLLLPTFQPSTEGEAVVKLIATNGVTLPEANPDGFKYLINAPGVTVAQLLPRNGSVAPIIPSGAGNEPKPPAQLSLPIKLIKGAKLNDTMAVPALGQNDIHIPLIPLTAVQEETPTSQNQPMVVANITAVPQIVTDAANFLPSLVSLPKKESLSIIPTVLQSQNISSTPNLLYNPSTGQSYVQNVPDVTNAVKPIIYQPSSINQPISTEATSKLVSPLPQVQLTSDLTTYPGLLPAAVPLQYQPVANITIPVNLHVVQNELLPSVDNTAQLLKSPEIQTTANLSIPIISSIMPVATANNSINIQSIQSEPQPAVEVNAKVPPLPQASQVSNTSNPAVLFANVSQPYVIANVVNQSQVVSPTLTDASIETTKTNLDNLPNAPEVSQTPLLFPQPMSKLTSAPSVIVPAGVEYSTLANASNSAALIPQSNMSLGGITSSANILPDALKQNTEPLEVPANVNTSTTIPSAKDVQVAPNVIISPEISSAPVSQSLLLSNESSPSALLPIPNNTGLLNTQNEVRIIPGVPGLSENPITAAPAAPYKRPTVANIISSLINSPSSVATVNEAGVTSDVISSPVNYTIDTAASDKSNITEEIETAENPITKPPAPYRRPTVANIISSLENISVSVSTINEPEVTSIVTSPPVNASINVPAPNPYLVGAQNASAQGAPVLSPVQPQDLEEAALAPATAPSNETPSQVNATVTAPSNETPSQVNATVTAPSNETPSQVNATVTAPSNENPSQVNATVTASSNENPSHVNASTILPEASQVPLTSIASSLNISSLISSLPVQLQPQSNASSILAAEEAPTPTFTNASSTKLPEDLHPSISNVTSVSQPSPALPLPPQANDQDLLPQLTATAASSTTEISQPILEKQVSAPLQYKEIVFAIRIYHIWEDELAVNDSVPYVDLSGVIEQAIDNVLAAKDPFYVDIGVQEFLRDPEKIIIAHIMVRFLPEELHPVEIIKSAIQNGNLTGITVDKDFFFLLSYDKSSSPEAVRNETLQNAEDYLAGRKQKPKPLMFKEIRFSLKMSELWNSSFDNNNSMAYAMFSGMVEQAMDRGLMSDSNYIDSTVLELEKTQEATTLVYIAVRFRIQEEDLEKKLVNLIKNGSLSGIPLDKNFFEVFSLSETHHPKIGEHVKPPDEVPLLSLAEELAGSKGQKQSATNDGVKIKSNDSQVANASSLASQAPITSALINITQPRTELPIYANAGEDHTVSNDVITPTVTNPPNIAQSVASDRVVTISPSVNMKTTVTMPPPDVPDILSTKGVATESPLTTTPVLPPSDNGATEKPGGSALNQIEGSMILQQKWHPYLSDKSSNEYKGLEEALVSEIKNIYAQTNEEVIPQVVSFGEAEIPDSLTKNGSDTQISVHFKIMFLPGHESNPVPLQAAVETNSLGDVTIYPTSFVLQSTDTFLPANGFTSCQQLHSIAVSASDGQIGGFIPECNPDGNFKSVQCHALTGFCWCVNHVGVRITGTEERYKEPSCEGMILTGKVILPNSSPFTLPSGSCLTVSIQEFLLCGGDINCHIPLLGNKTFKDVVMVNGTIAYSLPLMQLKPGTYVLTAVVNVGWCRINSVLSKDLIHQGDYHNTILHDVVVGPNTKVIHKDIKVELLLPEETGINLSGDITLPDDAPSPLPSGSCLVIQTKSWNPAYPIIGNMTVMEPDVVNNTMSYVMHIPDIDPGSYIIRCILHLGECDMADNTAKPGDYFMEKKYQVSPDTTEVEEDLALVEQADHNKDLSESTTPPTIAPTLSVLSNKSPDVENVASPATTSTATPDSSTAIKPVVPVQTFAPVNQTNLGPVSPPSSSAPSPVLAAVSPPALSGPSPPALAATSTPDSAASSPSTSAMSPPSDSAAIPLALPVVTAKNSSVPSAEVSSNTKNGTSTSSDGEFDYQFTLLTNPNFVDPKNRTGDDGYMVQTGLLSTNSTTAPITNTSDPLFIALPNGLPKSCQGIRDAGIGNIDGQYIIEARPGCHISVICVNMDDENTKEFLGGPSEAEWKYWHYAVLIKISESDKRNLPKGACLEFSEPGKELLHRIMIAGSRDGSPISKWKTKLSNIIRRKRNLPKKVSIITRPKLIRITKEQKNKMWTS